MTLSEKDSSRIHTENQLLNEQIDFSAAYLAVQYLFSHIKKSRYSITKQTIKALLSVIQLKRFDAQKQVFFLCKEAASSLIHISADIRHPLSGYIILELQNQLLSSSGRRHRAISEALGSLPVKIMGPDIEKTNQLDMLELTFDSFLSHCKKLDSSTFQWHGRTLRYDIEYGKIACIKFAKSKENVTELQKEIYWLNFLKENPPCRHSDFRIPIPVCSKDKYIFKLTHLPNDIFNNNALYKEHIAIAFIAEKEYFHYPNEPGFFKDHKESIKEIFQRNAWLLGKLTSKGIIHTALIPLFHNQVQQSRREDQGIYRWEQGGRLDKWLESCRYPNFAKSGLRDFEHLESINDTKQIRHFIGEHILGFVLVMGSYFRNKSPQKKGLDNKGLPLDMRNLFDKSLFIDLFTDVVRFYYQGVTGIPLKTLHLFFNEELIDCLIENMGIDHHMEEILRIQDQNNMSDSDFNQFLFSRGYLKSEKDPVHKGEKDIVLNTGPHLGGFNQLISVPELIDFLFCLSSLCISDRYIMENGLKAQGN